MPELPEVETIRLGLTRYLPGKVIKNITVRVPKLFRGKPDEAQGGKVKTIRRRAKILLIDLDNSFTLVIHLKLTGQLVYQADSQTEKIVGGHPQAAYNQPLPHAHTHVIITFGDGSRLFFNDLRKFGWIQVVETDQAERVGLLKTVGPEPLSPSFTSAVLRQQLTRYPKRLIFAALTDQSLVAGIGNIYVNEALYEAGIAPTRRVGEVREDEWPKLWRALRHVLRAAIRVGGTSDSTFVSVEGKRGNYLKRAHVYHKKVASPCGHPVITKRLAGRTAHFCQRDQS